MARRNKIQRAQRRLIQLFMGGMRRVTAGQHPRNTGGVCGAEYGSNVKGAAQII